ncbi:precorrin-2 C(20)-methyltransferase [Actinomadura logoneensis]|uniref:Precorrin-2 C(20)-methyltransferase n=1 Tax=Actinomadura logoneensis TaxID=2293572 RepID=A0A372JLA9_9ACTN|nr:precorrin-2 C(20)-methyltransferase [Actinomadura logoneensis]RFU40606.1 precorrin-2 C(20)-methyltransferase [Actinomadura logoneensis]
MNESVFQGPVRLTAERTVIRQLTLDDAEALVAIVREEPEILPQTLQGVHDAEALAHWLTVSVPNGQRFAVSLHLAIADRGTDTLVGFLGLFKVDTTHDTCEVGYALRAGVRGRGHATEALRLACDWALNDCGLHRVELRTLTDNIASMRVAEKAGFRREGVQRGAGRHQDLVMFSRLATDAVADGPVRLVGVGVGPGDPELVTVKAVRLLQEADVVLVPVLAPDEPGRAESVVREHTAKAERVVFALNDRGGVTPKRAAAWDAAATRVLEAFEKGARTVVFATIGDPNVYSTFTYLAQGVRAGRPDVVVETVPGVTAMQDLAARSGTVLAEGSESVTLVPLTAGTDGFRAALATDETVVAYKFGSRASEVVAALKDAGRLDDAVYGARLGLPGEDVGPAAALDGPVPYLSTLIVPGRRTGRGGKL